MLRPYQVEAVNAIQNEWNNGNKKTLLVLPTGTGKTIVFSDVIKNQVQDGSRALILAHRGELLDQAATKLKEQTGLDSALEKAGSTSLGSKFNVTVASIQSLSQIKRLDKFPADYFKTIVVDEAHHVLSDTYQTVLSHFNQANVLGVTAPPDRGDQKNLGQYFNSKAYEYSMRQAIKEGYLCPIKAQMIPLKLDIKSVGMSNGDFAVGDIGTSLEPYLNQIAVEMTKYCKDRKTVVFLPLIETSQKFCELLNLHGVRAVEVNGKSQDRTKVIKDFENGEYDVLCNSSLLIEGWDCPAVDCVIVLRPTRVRSLYQQMIGRGTRLYPGKENLLILDFLWLTERHDLCKPSSLISKDEDIASRINKKLMDTDSAIDLIEADESSNRDAIEERERALAKQLSEMKKKKQKLVDPIQYAFSIEAEDLANYEPTFAWEMGPATDKQIECLEKLGICADEVKNAGLASLLIEKLKNRRNEGLATPRQIRYLEKVGFVHVGLWSFDAATKMINRLAANNWKIPWEIDVKRYHP